MALVPGCLDASASGLDSAGSRLEPQELVTAHEGNLRHSAATVSGVVWPSRGIYCGFGCKGDGERRPTCTWQSGMKRVCVVHCLLYDVQFIRSLMPTTQARQQYCTQRLCSTHDRSTCTRQQQSWTTAYVRRSRELAGLTAGIQQIQCIQTSRLAVVWKKKNSAWKGRE